MQKAVQNPTAPLCTATGQALHYPRAYPPFSTTLHHKQHHHAPLQWTNAVEGD